MSNMKDEHRGGISLKAPVDQRLESASLQLYSNLYIQYTYIQTHFALSVSFVPLTAKYVLVNKIRLGFINQKCKHTNNV